MSTPPPSSSPNFFAKLTASVASKNSYLCIGLDPHHSELRLPPLSDCTPDQVADAALSFCLTMIDQTYEYACCYKPNCAFFESLGARGHEVLHAVIAAAHGTPGGPTPVLLDSKRGDIGSTAMAYATVSFHHLQADAVTLSPLMGYDSIEPFLTKDHGNTGAFLLCKTSNPGSNDLMVTRVVDEDGCGNGNTNTNTCFLYEQIAKLVHKWNEKLKLDNGTTSDVVGLVVGATDVTALTNVRSLSKDLWILAPGIGFQGGDLKASALAGMNDEGDRFLVPVSRGVSRAENRKEKARELRDAINEVREIKRRHEKSGRSDDNTKTTTTTAAATDVQPYQTEFIKFALQVGVLKFGTFTLKSGRISPYFFNAGGFDDGISLSRLGRCYASSIMSSSELTCGADGGASSTGTCTTTNNNNNNNNSSNITTTFSVIFGPAYKGISLGAVVAAALYDMYGVNVGFCYNRKEAKDHGEGGLLVGADMVGKKVLVVDDVISAGTAIRESYDMLTKIGAIPVGVSIALDRAEKRALDDPVSAVQAVARDLNIPVVSIVGLGQLFGYLQTADGAAQDQTVLDAVKKYRDEYGVE
jgi:orotidine 5'-phosphate decarboxylase subfamily 2